MFTAVACCLYMQSMGNIWIPVNKPFFLRQIHQFPISTHFQFIPNLTQNLMEYDIYSAINDYYKHFIIVIINLRNILKMYDRVCVKSYFCKTCHLVSESLYIAALFGIAPHIKLCLSHHIAMISSIGFFQYDRVAQEKMSPFRGESKKAAKITIYLQINKIRKKGSISWLGVILNVEYSSTGSVGDK